MRAAAQTIRSSTTRFRAAWPRGCGASALARLAEMGVNVAICPSLGDDVFGGDMRELAFRPPTVKSLRTLGATVPWFPRRRARLRWLVDGHVTHLEKWRSPPPPWAGHELRRRWSNEPPIARVARTPQERLNRFCTDEYWTAIASSTIAHGLPIRLVDVTMDRELLGLACTIRNRDSLIAMVAIAACLHRVIATWVTPAVSNRNTKADGNLTLPRTPLLAELSRGREPSNGAGWSTEQS